MNILLIGADGQLGNDLSKLIRIHNKDFNLHESTIDDLDITDLNATYNFIKRIKPDCIINCAAYTNVDECESKRELAFAVNSTGIKNIALAAIECDSSVVYISTDYVFDGNKNSPYNETDMPAPLNVYGKSKLEGENELKDISEKHYIIRTSWLYGENGANFVKTIVRHCSDRKTIRVVNDQIGTPTDTNYFAQQILQIVQNNEYGIFHASCNGQCSWYDFAVEIVKLLDLGTDIEPIESVDYPLPAERPKYSVLDNYRLRLQGQDIMPHWRDSIRQFLKNKCVEELL